MENLEKFLRYVAIDNIHSDWKHTSSAAGSLSGQPA